MSKAFIYGAIFGLIAPMIGLFAGLQLSTVLGNLLMFPFYIIGLFTEEPFGNWSMAMRITGVLISMITWGAVFYLISKLVKR